MPDEAQAPETPDTPAPEPEAPDQGHAEESQAAVDFEKRYNDLRPEYDRVTQRSSQLEQLISAAQQGDPEALDALGLEPAEDDTQNDDEYVDPYESLSQKVESLEEMLARQQEEEQNFARFQQENEYVNSEVEKLEQKLGRDIGEEEYDLITSWAASMRDEQGRPDVAAAYDKWDKLLNAKKKDYFESKKAPQVGTGAAATKEVNLDDPNERHEYIVSRLNQMDQSS